jgi:hypothetical protein
MNLLQEDILHEAKNNEGTARIASADYYKSIEDS